MTNLGLEIEYSPEFGISIPSKGWVPAPRYLMRRNRILFHMPQSDHGSLVEVGCGAGALTADFRKIGYDCHAIEISEQALSLARFIHRDDSRVTIGNSIDHLPIGGFDILVSCEVIEHIENDHEAIQSWSGLLKSDGLAIISAPSRPNKWNATDVWAGHFRRYTEESLSSLCESAGLEPFRLESYGFPLINFTDPIHAWLNQRRINRMKDNPRSGEGRDAATKQSGVNRSIETRIFPLIKNQPGKFIFRRFVKLQRSFLKGERGNGLICWARKK